MTDTAQRLAAELKQNREQNSRTVLVIDGDCAAGKTTLAAQLSAQLRCNVIHIDDFFLPPALRTEARLQEPGGNIDYERFISQVLIPLTQNKPFAYDAYSCRDGSLSSVPVQPELLTIIEGSYALHPRFQFAYRVLHTIQVFMRISADEQISRIRLRSGEAMLRRFREEWIPMEKLYQQTYEKDWTDVRFIDG